MFLYTPKKVRKQVFNTICRTVQLVMCMGNGDLEVWRRWVITSFTPKIQAAGSSETSL